MREGEERAEKGRNWRMQRCRGKRGSFPSDPAAIRKRFPGDRRFLDFPPLPLRTFSQEASSYRSTETFFSLGPRKSSSRDLPLRHAFCTYCARFTLYREMHSYVCTQLSGSSILCYVPIIS